MNFLFKCYKCHKVQSVDRTLEQKHDTLKLYNPNEPCPFCGLPMVRIYIDPLDVTYIGEETQ